VAGLPEQLSTWQEIQGQLVGYIPSIAGSYASIQKLSSKMGMKMNRTSANASIEKEGLKVITTRGKGTFTFWVKPVFRDIQFIGVSISSGKDMAPLQIYMDLIKPIADMLRKETSSQAELKITPR